MDIVRINIVDIVINMGRMIKKLNLDKINWR